MLMDVDTEVIMLRALLPVCCCCCCQWLCWRWYSTGMDGCMSPVVAVLVPWDVAICVVVARVHQNADISMSGLGVNCSGTVGDCAITSGCAGAGGVRQQNR